MGADYSHLGVFADYTTASCNDPSDPSCLCGHDHDPDWGLVILGNSPTCFAISKQHLCVRFQRTHNTTVDLCDCNPTWSTSDPIHSGNCTLPHNMLWMPIGWAIVAGLAAWVAYKSAHRAYKMLVRHKHKLNAANATAIMISGAMVVEIGRHLTYSCRSLGWMGDVEMKNSQTVFLGLVVNLLVTGLCTLALAWIDIAKKSKKLKVAKGGERRAVVFHRGQVFLRVMILLLILATIYFAIIDKLSNMSLVATVAQTILIPVLYVGARRLNKLLGKPKPGHVDLGGLIKRTVTWIAATWFVNVVCATFFIFNLERSYDLAPTQATAPVLNFIAVAAMSLNSVFVGFAMWRFFEETQPKEDSSKASASKRNSITRLQTDLYASRVETTLEDEMTTNPVQGDDGNVETSSYWNKVDSEASQVEGRDGNVDRGRHDSVIKESFARGGGGGRGGGGTMYAKARSSKFGVSGGITEGDQEGDMRL